MTELAEGVKIGVTSLEGEADCECDQKDEDKGWKSRVNKFNSQEKCTGTRLYDNMNGAAAAHVAKDLGVVPKKVAGTAWKLDLVTSDFFPVQAHHLIPKNFLPDHRVKTWLAIKFKGNPKYELRYDSSYDTDAEDNGYCMPYATPLEEWKGSSAEKTAVAFSVMQEVGIQLHQGSHAVVLDAKKLEEMAGKPIIPDIQDISPGGDSDDLEDSQIHEPGYLHAVRKLLNVVDAKAEAHAESCAICRAKKKGKKVLVLPTESVVDLMHRASYIIKVLIESNIIFVSGYGYFYAHHKRDLVVRDGRVHAKITKTALRSAVNN